MVQMLLGALDLIQKVGIVHGDLKPENILIQIQDNKVTSLKVIDFGSSFEYTDMKMEISTPEYLPPEILQQKSIGIQPWSTDIWSLGIILIEMVISFPVYMAYKGRVCRNFDGEK
jgi:serine/threonine protein kinase